MFYKSRFREESSDKNYKKFIILFSNLFKTHWENSGWMGIDIKKVNKNVFDAPNDPNFFQETYVISGTSTITNKRKNIVKFTFYKYGDEGYASVLNLSYIAFKMKPNELNNIDKLFKEWSRDNFNIFKSVK